MADSDEVRLAVLESRFEAIEGGIDEIKALLKERISEDKAALAKLEERLRHIEDWRNQLIGVSAAMGILASLAIEAVKALVKGGH